MKINTHTILTPVGAHFIDGGQKVTIEFTSNEPGADVMEKYLSLLPDLFKEAEFTKSANTNELDLSGMEAGMILSGVDEKFIQASSKCGGQFVKANLNHE